jgi:hypothetical protein
MPTMPYAADMPVLIGLALLAFWLYCLFDVITTPEEHVRNLPKVLWVLIVVLLITVGGLLWMLLGRPLPQQAHTPGGGAFGGGYGGSSGRRQQPSFRGPEDDPEFLRSLERRLRGEE